MKTPKKTSAIKTTPRANYFRCQITMPKAMSDYLEQLGSRCKELQGFKLSKCETIRALILSLQGVHKELELDEVRTEVELSERINKAFAKVLSKKK